MRWTGLDATCQRYRQLTDEEEAALVKKAQAGCRNSRDFLIENNVKFIIAELIKQFPQQDYFDLLGSAVIGVDGAIARFDPAVGTRFISYAVLWIKRLVQRQIATDMPIKEPEEYYYKRWLVDNRMQECGETATEAAIALGISDRVLQQMSRQIVALDAPLSDESSMTFAEVLPDADAVPQDVAVIKTDTRASVLHCLEQLHGRDYEVLIKRFGFNGHAPMKLQEIGDEWGLTRQSILKIEEKAKAKLRRYLNRAGIDPRALEAF